MSRSVRCLDRTLLSSHSHLTHSHHRPHTLRTAHPQQPTTAPAIPWSEGAGDYDMIMIVISNVKHSSVLVSKHTIGKVILSYMYQVSYRGGGAGISPPLNSE